MLTTLILLLDFEAIIHFSFISDILFTLDVVQSKVQSLPLPKWDHGTPILVSGHLLVLWIFLPMQSMHLS